MLFSNTSCGFPETTFLHREVTFIRVSMNSSIMKMGIDVSFWCVVKSQRRWSNKIYKTELTKIINKNQVLCKYRVDPQRAGFGQRKLSYQKSISDLTKKSQKSKALTLTKVGVL